MKKPNVVLAKNYGKFAAVKPSKVTAIKKITSKIASPKGIKQIKNAIS